LEKVVKLQFSDSDGLDEPALGVGALRYVFSRVCNCN